MKSLIVGTGVVGLLVAGVMLSAIANADEPMQRQIGFGYERALEAKAAVLGMDQDQLMQQLRDKTMAELAAEQGMSLESFQAEMKQVREQRWRALGLSEEEQQARTEAAQQRHENCDGSGNAEGGEQHRYGHNR